VKKLKISASILGCDFSKIGQEIMKAENAKVDIIHLDVMDGHFVPNISFGSAIIKSLRGYTNLPFEVHLMISDPRKYLKDFVNAGADTIIFHAEINGDILRIIKEIKKYGKKVGLAVNPETDAKKVFPYLKYLDLIIIMTVHPGFGGQSFMKDQVYKVYKIKDQMKYINKSDLEIELDGGVNLDTIKFAKNANADICVSGSFLFHSKDISETVKLLKSTSL
jgi:ribulose-phosphate 3-epimerase